MSPDKGSIRSGPIPDALLGIRAKLERADESIKHLDAEISAFARSATYETVTHFENNSTEYVISVRGDPTVPARFAVIAGEIIHHFRSVLDHLVVALVAAQRERPLNTHQFPIRASGEEFEKSVNTYVKGVSQLAFKLIETEQPYHAARPEDHFLTVLHQFDITDKHRILLITATAVTLGDQVTVGTDYELAKHLGISEPERTITNFSAPKRREITKKGAEVFRISLAKPDPTFKADADITVHLAFRKAGPVDLIPVTKVLTGFRDATADLIDHFLGEFV